MKMMQRIQEAYETLRDTNLWARYDAAQEAHSRRGTAAKNMKRSRSPTSHSTQFKYSSQEAERREDDRSKKKGASGPKFHFARIFGQRVRVSGPA